MWVLQTGCSGISGDRDLWDPNSSESAKKEDQPFQLEYGVRATLNGDRYTDSVTIAGLTADSQPFGSVTSLEADETFSSDGLLGLGSFTLTESRPSPLLASLYAQNKITSMTFSLKLASSGAELYIGGANRMLYKGDIAYVRVTHPTVSGWQVTMDDILVNGDRIFRYVGPVLFDTEANYIYGTWGHVSALYKRIGGKLHDHDNYGFYSLPCNSFPTMSFTFGGKTFQIPPELLNLGPIAPDSPDCFSAIIGRRSRFWSIGNPFLQSVYTVFDYGTGIQARVGFAELA